MGRVTAPRSEASTCRGVSPSTPEATSSSPTGGTTASRSSLPKALLSPSTARRDETARDSSAGLRPSPWIDDGLVYVADWGNERVQVFAPDGSPVQLLRGEATLSKWARDFFNANPDERVTRDVADLHPDLPDHLASPDHQSSQTEAYFWGPVSVKLDPNQRLFVSETNRHRLQIYNTN